MNRIGLAVVMLIAVVSFVSVLYGPKPEPKVLSRVCVKTEQSSYPSMIPTEDGGAIFIMNYVDNCVRWVPELPGG